MRGNQSRRAGRWNCQLASSIDSRQTWQLTFWIQISHDRLNFVAEICVIKVGWLSEAGAWAWHIPIIMWRQSSDAWGMLQRGHIRENNVYLVVGSVHQCPCWIWEAIIANLHDEWQLPEPVCKFDIRTAFLEMMPCRLMVKCVAIACHLLKCRINKINVLRCSQCCMPTDERN